MTISKGLLFPMDIMRAASRFLPLLVLTTVLVSQTALAHRLIVFGWVDGEQVITQSRFSNRKAVKGGDISVFDIEGNQILNGKTDSRGRFAFRIPGKKPLKVLLTTSPGHQARWLLSEADLATATTTSKHASFHENEALTDNETFSTPVNQDEDCSCQREDIESAIEKSIDRKLSPVLEYIAESQNSPVSIKDVLGGIGYIIGLVGLAAYLRFRSGSGSGS